MQKIVINKYYGCFGLSDRALTRYRELSGDVDTFYKDIERNNPCLVKVVEELKDEANNMLSDLKVIEVPDDIEWVVEEYGGMEWVAEAHKTWK